MTVQGEGVGLPKRTQSGVAPHPSTTAAQRNPGGRAHAVLSGVGPAQPLTNAHSDIGKPTPVPPITYGQGLRRADDGTSYNPAMSDALLDEAHCNNLLPGERHHSCSGPKGC
jgi:hypothetical protein